MIEQKSAIYKKRSAIFPVLYIEEFTQNFLYLHTVSIMYRLNYRQNKLWVK